MTVPRTEMNGLVLGVKMGDVALCSMRDKPKTVTICSDSECMIAAVDSENGSLKPYLANRKAVIIGKMQEWKQKFPGIEVEEIQHVPGSLNPADLPTRATCSVKDV